MSEGVRKLSVEFDDEAEEYYVRHGFGTQDVIVHCISDEGDLLMPVITKEDADSVTVKPVSYLLDRDTGDMYEVPLNKKIAKIVVIG